MNSLKQINKTNISSFAVIIIILTQLNLVITKLHLILYYLKLNEQFYS